VPGFIGDVTLDHAHEGVHPLGAFSQRLVKSFAVSVAPFCAFLQPIQALISALGKKPSAFREFPDQHFEVCEVTSLSSDVGSQLSHVVRELIDPRAELVNTDAELANQRVILAWPSNRN